MNITLLMDFYELTMAYGYFKRGMHNEKASFDLFFRKNPFKSGYSVFAGLESVKEYIDGFRFDTEDIEYIKELGIKDEKFLDYLKNLKLSLTINSVAEGTVVFPNEPLMSVSGNLIECQLVESALLNMINFQTLIATKTSRITTVTDKPVLEFGLRRSQGVNGALSATRAAFIGGANFTSNVLAGKVLGTEKVAGTHAHSWVMSYKSEIDSFRAYADVFPSKTLLLIDTYDTLNSGLVNAITIAEELRAKGHELFGVRLDSGDLAYLSRKVKEGFIKAGFPAVKIVVSNDLDEYVISALEQQGAMIDVYGVGTRLITGHDKNGGGALGGVYKIVELSGEPKIKKSNNVEKITVPYGKHLYRAKNKAGFFEFDFISRSSKFQPDCDIIKIFDIINPLNRFKANTKDLVFENIRELIYDKGEYVYQKDFNIFKASDFRVEQLKKLPEGCIRIVNPHLYKVGLDEELYRTRMALIDAF